MGDRPIDGGFSSPFSYSGGMMIPNEYLVGGLEHGFYFPQELVGCCLIQSDEHFFGLEWINHKKKIKMLKLDVEHWIWFTSGRYKDI